MLRTSAAAHLLYVGGLATMRRAVAQSSPAAGEQIDGDACYRTYVASKRLEGGTLGPRETSVGAVGEGSVPGTAI